jgi:hypothetical protein
MKQSGARPDGPADFAALAVHLMTQAALTGATYDADGDEQVASGA